MTSAIL